jgi:hypothetical protein
VTSGKASNTPPETHLRTPENMGNLGPWNATFPDVTRSETNEFPQVTGRLLEFIEKVRNMSDDDVINSLNLNKVSQ